MSAIDPVIAAEAMKDMHTVAVAVIAAGGAIVGLVRVVRSRRRSRERSDRDRDREA